MFCVRESLLALHEYYGECTAEQGDATTTIRMLTMHSQQLAMGHWAGSGHNTRRYWLCTVWGLLHS